MKDKIKELEQITKPIVDFIKENYNLHTSIVINEKCIKVVSDEISIPVSSH